MFNLKGILMTELEIEYERLKIKYKNGRLTKDQLASELNISVVTVSRRLKTGKDIPNYQKAEGKTSRVYFPILEVAKYLVKTTKTKITS